jgi:threonine/homoserine/homoserine lactone efflux protein
MFLIFIGLRIFSSNPGKQIRRLKLKGNNYYKDFITSFFLTISNPLTILAFGAFFTGLGMVDKTGGSFPVVVMIVSVFSGALAWWIGLISIITIFKRRIRLRSLLWINRITGTFIVLFALYLILTVFIPEISAL